MIFRRMKEFDRSDKSISPAVQSVVNERKRQRKRSPLSDLEGALKDTFPASDPISAIHTAIPAGRTDVQEAEDIAASGHIDRFEDSYPIGKTSVQAASGEQNSGVRGTRRNVRTLYRAALDEKSQRFDPLTPTTEGASAMYEIKRKIRQKPLLAIMAAMAVGFVVSASR